MLRIALLLESSRPFGRGVLDALSECLRGRRHWLVYYQEGGLGELLPKWFLKWRGDGVIARIETRAMARLLQRKRIPTVDIRGIFSLPGIPVVSTDSVEIARLAAEHLLGLGLKRFAYCGYEGAHYSVVRRDAFVRIIRDAGHECHVFNAGEPSLSAVRLQEQYGWAHEKHLIQWLQALPKPIGIMACNDARGHQVLNAARQTRLSVPDDVAVIGVDNHQTICELTVPPLSSVEQNTRRIASEAVRLLEDLLAGRPAPTAPILVKPCKVVARRSSDALAIPDPNLRQAVAFIREKINSGIGVVDVARAAGLSRRELERRFLTLSGHSPGHEILTVQMQLVRALLTETDWPLYQIAEKAGFNHPEYLNVAFKRQHGMTPRAYRLKMALQRRG